MSTTRLPPAPEPKFHEDYGPHGNHFNYHTADQMHAYGLAVWKAAIESLIAELGPAAEAHREAAREETDQRCKEWHAATAASYTTVVELARSLSLPEQGSPQ